MRDALYLIALVTGAALYVAPCVIAHWRRHRYRWPITAINLLLGVTGIGWLVCLVWALWPGNPRRPGPQDADPPVKLIRN
jgi:hypothetical protein